MTLPYILPYARERDPAEFMAMLDVAIQLSSDEAKARQDAEDALVTAGARAVAPLACSLELTSEDGSRSDADVELHSQAASRIVERIGADALLELELLLDDGRCDLAVDEWAQELIFKLNFLTGPERRTVCRHMVRSQQPWRGGTVWRCLACGARFGGGELPDRRMLGPRAPEGRRKGGRRARGASR